MITISQKDNKLYIGVDYPTPKPDIPDIRPGKIYELYEITIHGLRLIGKYTAIEKDDSIEVGPLKISAYFSNSMKLEYRGYYQIIVLSDNKPDWPDSTPLEEFESRITYMLFTDDREFFEAAWDSDEFWAKRTSISLVDGVLRTDNHIRRIDNEEIKITLENNALYICTIDTSKIPPVETSRTKIVDIPFTIKNGIIKKVKIRDDIELLVNYRDFKMIIHLSKTTGRPTKLIVVRGEKRNVVSTFIDGVTPEIITSLIKTIDEHGVESFELIKTLGDAE